MHRHTSVLTNAHGSSWETDEHPQLYFSHQFKTGDAVQLAQEVRAGLNLTNSKFK